MLATAMPRSDLLLSKLRRLAEDYVRTHANGLGSIEAAERKLITTRTEQHKRAAEIHAKAVAVARNRAAQRVMQNTMETRDAAPSLLGSVDSALAAADYINLGKLQRSGSPMGVNESVLPRRSSCLSLVVSHLIVDCAPDRAPRIAQQVVWQAFSRTAPAQLDVVGYDPLLKGALSPFAGMKSASGRLFTVINRPVDLDEIVERLASDVQRVNDTMRGSGATLLEYRAQVGHPVERLQLVVLMDYPTGVSEQTHRQIVSLARVGPTAGISFLVLRDSAHSAPPKGYKTADMDLLGDRILEQKGSLSWVRHPEFTVELSVLDPVELARKVDALATQASSASSPKVAFSSVQPVSGPPWQASSAEGVTFSLGAAGQHTVEVTLGDERDQRHNALITGAVGQGKSNLLKVIIHSLGQRYSPDELELYLLDFKEGVTLYPFAPTPGSPDFLPHARVLGLESDRDFGLSVLHHVEAEMSRRAKIFRPYGDNIGKYRTAALEARMPRIVVMIDEFHLLFEPSDQTSEEAARRLEALARRGRSYGVHLILASQTISGISALLARESGIFSQFPIRIALKNALNESFATLSQGNDGAARLRIRGEAVLNLDYGALAANRSIVVAAAEDEELSKLRTGWWTEARSKVNPPIVFDGGKLVRPSAAINVIGRLRRRVLAQGTAPSAIVGLPISVEQEPLTVTLAADPGRNIAILGAGEKAGQIDEADEVSNNAIGVLQTATLSLALQHPLGDAEFVSLDLLDDVTAQRNNHESWLNLMERLGFPVRRVPRPEIAAYLQELAERLNERLQMPVTYVLGFGLDRAGNLETPDMFAHRPLDDLQTILRDGPVNSVHLIAWWSNAATFKSHLGFGGEGFVETLLMLRLDKSAVQDFLGPFVTWSVRDNRGLLSDRTQLAEPLVIVPFAPLENRDATLFLNSDWDQSQ